MRFLKNYKEPNNEIENQQIKQAIIEKLASIDQMTFAKVSPNSREALENKALLCSARLLQLTFYVVGA